MLLSSIVKGSIAFFANNNTVGGTANGAGNTIAFNGGSGVKAFGGVGNTILSNSILSNAGLGIDLSGVTANDAGDGDTGPNNGQNSPEATAAEINVNGTLVVQYSVDSTVLNSAYPVRVEFFKADTDAEEGKTFLGNDDYPAGSAQSNRAADLGNAASLGITSGDVIVATATDTDGNTSEFSQNIQVTAFAIPIPGVTRWGLPRYGGRRGYPPSVPHRTSQAARTSIDTDGRCMHRPR